MHFCGILLSAPKTPENPCLSGWPGVVYTRSEHEENPRQPQPPGVGLLFRHVLSHDL